MSERKKVVVVGLGEVGRPIYTLVSKRHDTIGVDVSPPAGRIEGVDLLHICYPFQINDFVGVTIRYIELFRPTLTIVNSTVAIGTTRAIVERTGSAVVHSPVRGKHARMLDELRTYTKFIGAMDLVAGQKAAEHFESVGLKTKILSSPEATELAKLTETTYFGLMIAWAQEIERYCDSLETNYDEIVSFYKEIGYLPPVTFFPGIIGGHCVLPNIEILSGFQHTAILEAIEASNRLKVERETEVKRALEAPAPLVPVGKA